MKYFNRLTLMIGLTLLFDWSVDRLLDRVFAQDEAPPLMPVPHRREEVVQQMVHYLEKNPQIVSENQPCGVEVTSLSAMVDLPLSEDFETCFSTPKVQTFLSDLIRQNPDEILEEVSNKFASFTSAQLIERRRLLEIANKIAKLAPSDRISQIVEIQSRAVGNSRDPAGGDNSVPAVENSFDPERDPPQLPTPASDSIQDSLIFGLEEEPPKRY